MNKLRNQATVLFGIDLRSLAAFRIGVAGILLLDLWYRSRETTAYFTDQGILPRAARIELAGLGSDFGMQHQWSLHMMAGEFWAQALLMLVAALFAFWMLIGYRSRLAAVTSWILLMSIHGRNPDILNSGDVLLRCMLMWSLFLPLGARFSVDANLAKTKAELPARVLSVASVAVLLQLCMMYWFSTAFKMKSLEDMPSPWTHGYSAVYYALNCDAYTSRFGLWLREFPQIMQVLTASSLWLEVIGPIVAFIPFQTKWFRFGVVVAFTLFHLGLAAAMTIGLFPVICIVCWILFLPSEFWECVTRRARSFKHPLATRYPSRRSESHESSEARTLTSSATLARQVTGLTTAARRWFRTSEQPHLARRWYTDVVLAILLVYVVVWNVREYDFKNLESSVLPRSLNAPARILGLDQNWSMFAPLPRTEDGWLMMEGTLDDGSIVNLWDFDKPIPWEKPDLVSATYHTQRWRKYLDNLTTESYGPHRMYFCDWLARRWNEKQADADASRHVRKVELSHRIEQTPPPGEPMPDLESRVLWTWYYE